MDNDNLNSGRVRVTVAYATPDAQVILPLDVPEGFTLEQVIVQSHIQARFPEINLAATKVGVFGKLSTLTTTVRDGDRIEIYRPLQADPKAARKQRAARK